MYVHVVATTGARKELVEEIHATKFSIAVREKPERNLANRRIQELLAAYFKVTPAAVRLINGHRRPQKLFDVKM